MKSEVCLDKFKNIVINLDKGNTVCVVLESDVAKRINLKKFKDDLYYVNKDVISISMIEMCEFKVVESITEISVDEVFTHLKAGRAAKIMVNHNELTKASYNVFSDPNNKYFYRKNVETSIK